MSTTQISAHIPDELKVRLDRYARATGSTRAHLVAEALQHHLQAASVEPREIFRGKRRSTRSLSR